MVENLIFKTCVIWKGINKTLSIKCNWTCGFILTTYGQVQYMRSMPAIISKVPRSLFIPQIDRKSNWKLTGLF